MALNNLTALYGSIYSSSTPITTSIYPVENILNGDNGQTGGQGGWQYTNDGNILKLPLQVIIDLNTNRPIELFKIFGLSYLWGGGSCPAGYSIAVAETPKNGVLSDNDFVIVWSSSMPKPTRSYLDRIWSNEDVIAIIPRMGRFVRISINSTWAFDSDWMGLGEVEVHGRPSLPTSTKILSGAEINTDLTIHHTIFSNANIDTNPPSIVETDKKTIFSFSIIAYMSEITSDAYILGTGKRLYSDAFISNNESTTIESNSCIKHTIASIKNIHIAFPGITAISNSQLDPVFGENYHPMLNTTVVTTSLATTVPDMFTGAIIDLADVNPPFGYQNYDWAYDWTIRTYNNATYLVEVREGNTLNDVNAAVFGIISLGSRIERGSISRYHQYRLHVWASGSGDFEFHQFTIKGFINNNINSYYKLLIPRPFLTTNSVNKEIPTTWETTEGTAGIWEEDYLPGDLNGDGKVDGLDLIYLYEWLFAGTGPPPSDYRTADINGDGTINVADYVYLNNWISGSGSPPRIRIK